MTDRTIHVRMRLDDTEATESDSQGVVLPAQPEHHLGAHWQLSSSAGLNQNVRGLGLWLCALTSPPTEPEEG